MGHQRVAKFRVASSGLSEPCPTDTRYRACKVSVTRGAAGYAAGANVRPMGSERAAGVEVLAAGRRLAAAEIGALAVLGQQEVEVVARPRVAIVATGDEVVPVDATPLPHQVRESNSWALAAQVRECGGVAERIGVEGLLLSEYAPGTRPRRHHFPLRNRLISGLCDAVLVLEAARASGSLITARWASDRAGRSSSSLAGSITP